MNETYEEAVNCINSLQSNQGYINNAPKHGVLPHSATISTTIAETKKYLNRTGVTLEQLDKLSIIHVAGTKGKGSTCAFCDNILREYGYKTGFYSSPHLVAIRERIRLDGKPLSKEVFGENALRIYNKLLDTREHPYDMPPYFRFLTILAFNIFLEEKVDVAIIEVGIGGEFDCTNIVRNTPIVGITSLGIDHTKLLGETIEQIAWQKAGIMKNNSKVFTVPQITPAMEILLERSIEKKCTLEVVPDFKEYLWNDETPTLGINGEIQKINASLAIQLAHNWLQLNEADNSVFKSTFQNKLTIPQKTRKGLETCKWPGRHQILQKSNYTFYIDGAHTTDSLEICANWYINIASQNVHNALIFNAIGERSSEYLLQKLVTINFKSVMFVPNRAFTSKVLVDQANLVNTDDLQLERCETHKNIWMKLKNFPNSMQNVSVFSSVEEAIKHLPNTEPTNILVTGSLHLVGALLSILDPDLETF